MNGGVWIPASTSLFIRRVVNVVGTFSIAHNYLPRPEKDSPPSHSTPSSNNSRISSSKCLRDAFDWSWKPRMSSPPGIGESTVTATGLSIPWLRLRWPTSSLAFSSEPTQESIPSSQPPYSSPDTPPPAPKSPPPPRPRKDNSQGDSKHDAIHRLLQHPALYDPIRAPRYPIVLCHGLYGFDVRGPSAFPSLRMQYWSTILGILRKTIGAEVIVTAVPGTGSIASRSEQLNRYLENKASGRGLNFMAHSMGGLDCRHLIAHVRPTEYTPLSLTTIATPHRGSPFMDWCTDYLGIGRNLSGKEREQTLQAARTALDSSRNPSSDSESPNTTRGDPKSDPKQSGSSSLSMSLSSLPSSFTTLLLSMFDSPAYANLTTTYLNTVFNPSTPDDPRVKYFSVAGRTESMNVWHPLWLPKLVLDGAEAKDRERLKSEAGNVLGSSALQSSLQYSRKAGERAPAPWDDDNMWGNDGLVTVQSARWGEFLGTMEGSDHWELRGASGIEVDVDLKESVRGWSNLDWSRFVRAWKKEEGDRKQREEKEKAREASSSSSSSVFAGPVPSPSILRLGDNVPGLHGVQRSSPRDSENSPSEADDILKSSTDRLSAVFDWIVDQVPTEKLPAKLPSIAHAIPLIGGAGGSTQKKSEEERREEVREKEREKRESKMGKSRKSDLETEKDLERFYVALAKKLYDEGL